MTTSDRRPTQLRLLSLGAGVQSTTLALLAVEGRLPRPDAAIFADTGWEPRRVYAHLDRLQPVLAAAGIPLLRVAKGNLREDSLDPGHRYASVPYFVLNAPFMVREPIQWAPCDHSGHDVIEADEDDWPCAPFGQIAIAWSEREATLDERRGMGRRQCTSEYKLAPINRAVREMLGASAPEYRRVPKGNWAEQWIGFSTDELGRVSDNEGVSYITRRYPLIELGMSRTACEAWLARRGWTVEAGRPVEKSSCIGCPYHGNSQWRALRDTCECGHHRDEHWQGGSGVGPCEVLNLANVYGNHRCSCTEFQAPEWEDAVTFDEQIRKGGARGLPLEGEAFLHRSRVPLSIAPIDHWTRGERRGQQLDLLDDLLAEEGDPDGCSPYGCRSGQAVPDA